MNDQNNPMATPPAVTAPVDPMATPAPTMPVAPVTPSMPEPVVPEPMPQAPVEDQGGLPPTTPPVTPTV